MKTSIVNSNGFNIEKLIIKYQAYLYKVIKSITTDLTNEDIEEIIEDVYLVLWNNKEKIDFKLPIEPYMVGIAKNLVKNKYRKFFINDNIEDYENTISTSIDIQLLIEQKEKNKIISSVLNNVDSADKEIFILYYFYNKSIKEISTQLKITTINVKTKLHRLRKKIQKKLIEGGYNYGK